MNLKRVKTQQTIILIFFYTFNFEKKKQRHLSLSSLQYFMRTSYSQHRANSSRWNGRLGIQTVYLVTYSEIIGNRELRKFFCRGNSQNDRLGAFSIQGL